jgi:hypothetical protein
MATIGVAQVSHHALRFYGAGTGQQDRVKIRIDNPATVLDVGSDFTIEFWMRCAAAQNNGTVSDTFNGDGWITGNVIVDRDQYSATDYGDYGISIGAAGATRVLAFGLASTNGGRTIVGTNNVGHNAWTHVAVTRTRSTGVLRIYVDGRLDAEGTGPTGDVSYRNGRPTSFTNSDPFLVLGAEKHDVGPAYPSYNGFLDELRVWTQALSQAQISNVFRDVIATNTPGLVAYYRFEEGSGTNVTDGAGLSPVGRLIAGVTNNGQWMARSVNTNWTAPLGPPAPPPPSTNVTIESVPPGLSVMLDGVAETTPFTRALPVTNLVMLAAPTNQSLNGTTYVFRCWSDGGAQNRSLLVPTNGLTLRAGYTAVSGGSLDQPVPANNRNIESYAGTNRLENLFVPNCLCAGRDNSPPLRYEPAMAFPLAVASGAVIQSAALRVRGNSDNNGAPQLVVRAFAVSNLAAFSAGAGASVTGLHPLTSAAVAWTPPAFSSGAAYNSPDLAPLVQEVVNLPGWSAGNFIGLLLTATNGSGDHWRCWSNFQSGTPPRLLVTYATGGAATNDLDGDGLPDDWEAQHGFDCTTAAAADADTDGDGVSDRAEFIALTSPTNAAHFQRLEILPVPASNVWKISFATATGRLYRIDAATNLLAPEWLPVATAWPGTGATADFTDTNDAPARYFRTGVELSP